MTTAEYLRTPETVLPRELAFGVMCGAEAPRASHQRVVVELLLGSRRSSGPMGSAKRCPRRST